MTPDFREEFWIAHRWQRCVFVDKVTVLSESVRKVAQMMQHLRNKTFRSHSMCPHHFWRIDIVHKDFGKGTNAGGLQNIEKTLR